MSDHANNAACVAAGWIRTQIDYGAGKNPRYATEYSKPCTGTDGAGGNTVARGEDNTSQANADTNALNALNKQRAIRYGAGATAGLSGSGKQLTHDQN